MNQKKTKIVRLIDQTWELIKDVSDSYNIHDNRKGFSHI